MIVRFYKKVTVGWGTIRPEEARGILDDHPGLKFYFCPADPQHIKHAAACWAKSDPFTHLGKNDPAVGAELLAVFEE